MARIPASLAPSTMTPGAITVSQQRDIKRYGSIEAANQSRINAANQKAAQDFETKRANQLQTIQNQIKAAQKILNNKTAGRSKEYKAEVIPLKKEAQAKIEELKKLQAGLEQGGAYENLNPIMSEINSYAKQFYKAERQERTADIKQKEAIAAAKAKQTIQPGQPLYVDIDDVNKPGATVYTSPDKTGQTYYMESPVVEPKQITPPPKSQETKYYYADIEDVNKPQATVFTSPDKTGPTVSSSKIILTKENNPLSIEAYKNRQQKVYDKFKITKPNAKVDKRVYQTTINKLVERGYTTLSNGLLVVTEEYARKNNFKDTSEVAYWILSSKNKEDIRNELTYARDNVKLYKSPMKYKEAGVFERNQANIEYQKEAYTYVDKAREEMQKEIKKFKENPEEYPEALGTSTEKGILYTLPEDYLKNLPAQKKLISFIDKNKEKYLDAQRRAREIRTTPSENNFNSAAASVSRNIRLEIGSGLTQVYKTAIGGVEFLGTGYKTLAMGGRIENPKEFNPFNINSFEFSKTSAIGSVKTIPTTPSVSGFKFTDPTTYNKFGQYVFELKDRPEILTQAGIITAAAGNAASNLKKTYQKEISNLIKESGKTSATTGLKIEAAKSVAYQTAGNFAIVKPAPFTNTATVSARQVKEFNKWDNGFIKIDVEGDIMGLPYKQKFLSPSDGIIKSKTTLPDETILGYSGTPIQIKTNPIIKGSEQVFLTTTGRYGAGGYSVSMTGLPTQQIQVVSYGLGISNPSTTAENTVVTKFPRQVANYETKAYKISDYKYGTKEIVNAKLEEATLVTKYYDTPGDSLIQRQKLYLRDINANSNVPGPIKISPDQSRIVSSGLSQSMTGEETKDVNQFSIGGRTLVDDSGKPLKGFIISTGSKSIDVIKTPTPKGSGGYSYIENFYPEDLLGGGGGGSRPISGSSSGNVPTQLLGYGGGPSQSPIQTSIQFNQPSVSSLAFLSQMNSPTTLPLQINQPSTSQLSPQLITQIPNNSTAQSPVLKISPISAVTTSTATSPITSTIAIPVATTIALPITVPVTTPITTPGKTPTINPPKPSIINPPKPPIIDISFGRKPKTSEELVQAYKAEVLTKKGFKKVSDKPYTKFGARDIVARFIDNTTAATGRMSPLKKKVPKSKLNKGDGYYSQTKNKYRGFRIVKGNKIPLMNTLIEKKNKRSDTPGEKSGLTIGQYKARRSKRAAGLPTRKSKKKTRTRFRL